MKLLVCMKTDKNKSKHNWALFISHKFFEPVEMELVWDNLSLASFLAYKPEILKKYKEFFYQLELRRK